MADTKPPTAEQGGMKKTLSAAEFFLHIGFGAIIGTGLGPAGWRLDGRWRRPRSRYDRIPLGRHRAGAHRQPAFGELTAAIPVSGGIVEYVDRTFGHTASYITGWFLALGNGILRPWEAIAISTLVSDMFGSLPGLEWLRAVKLYTILGADVYLFPTLIALAFAGYVIYLNFRGASSAAELQAFLDQGAAMRHAARHGRVHLHRLLRATQCPCSRRSPAPAAAWPRPSPATCSRA